MSLNIQVQELQKQVSYLEKKAEDFEGTLGALLEILEEQIGEALSDNSIKADIAALRTEFETKKEGCL